MIDSISISKVKTERSSKFLNKALWILILFLMVFSIVEIAFHFIIAPRIKIREVIINSDLALTEQEILSLAGLKRNEYYFFIDTAEIEKRIEKNPAVKNVVVEKIFPDTLKISLIGRSPLLIALVTENEKTIPISLDENGVVFQIIIPK